MCWDVPEISFFFQFRSYSRHAANGFVPHPLYVSHTGVLDTFVVFPPPPSWHLSYITVSESPCRHTSLIRFQILRMVVRAYVKCNKNHGALRSRAAVETNSRTCKALLFTREYMAVSRPLHISLIYFIYYLDIFRIYLTVSLCFSVCNCAQQVWSTGQRRPPTPPTPRNSHVSESSLELSLKGYMILNSSNCS